MKEKKPIYKKWWFWVIAVLAVLTIYGAIEGVNQAKEQIIEEETTKEVVEEAEPEEDSETNEHETEEPEEEQNEIEHDEKFTFGEFTVENMVTELDSDELTFKFHWINQSGKDKSPFTALGYVDVLQGDEILDEISGAYDAGNKTGILFKNANGGSHSVTLVYELVNDEPIQVRFGATHEMDETKEELIIEID